MAKKVTFQAKPKARKPKGSKRKEPDTSFNFGANVGRKGRSFGS